ncbi:hypothetical protein UPYG_G00115630 [Umbra pygmaea]|uniref:Hypoxia-inducible factor 1-alpha n=1 Tax=Umbra pygmaea TaxID=75934 RepID=A0ABD0XJ85_UMBPY
MFHCSGNPLETYCDRMLHRTGRKRITGQKRSRVSTERLRAQSRCAAKSRRERESRLFGELAAWLPLPPGVTGHMDKASIIRFTLGFLRLRALLDHSDNSVAEPRVSFDTVHFSIHGWHPMDEMLSEEVVLEYALGGFLLLVSENGQVIYATGDIHTHTGIHQMDLIGRSLFDFTHHCDQKEVRDIFSKNIATERRQKCSFLLRMKSTLTSQGQAVNQRHANWKAVHCVGVKKRCPFPETSCLILLCRPLPNSQCMVRDASLNHNTFVSRHSADMKFTHCHAGVKQLTGYTERELVGQSVYQYYHASDCQHIYRAHQRLLSKGQVTLGRYRLLLKGGGYVWTETDASVVYNRTGQPQSIICINYILSEVELPEMTFSLQQTEALLRPCFPEIEVGPSLQIDALPTAEAPVNLHNRTTTPEKTQTCEGYLELNLEDQMSMNPLSQLCELDLDSLAPYIPMDGEDFLLTPVLNGILDMTEGKPPNNRNVVNPDLEDHCSLGKVPTVSADSIAKHQINQMETEPVFNSEVTCTINGSELWNCMQPVCGGGCRGLKIDRDPACWDDSILKQQWSDKYYKTCRHPQGLLAAAWPPQNVKRLPVHPPDGFTCLYAPTSRKVNRKCTLRQKMPQSPVNHTEECSTCLPELSQLDCEVILGPVSYLLQGTEITFVLDQATTRFSHLTKSITNDLFTRQAHMYTPRPAAEICTGTSTLYAEWVT